MDRVELTYRVTANFPDNERYGLVTQMRRAANSIPSNLAEGHGVEMARWRLRHVRSAIGSSCELDTQLEIAARLRFIRDGAIREMQALLDRTQKLLDGMKREKERRLARHAGALTVIAVIVAARLLA